jgi:hypothetical protein
MKGNRVLFQLQLTIKKGLLDKLVIQSEKKEIQLFVEHNPTIYKVLLAIPALIGYLPIVESTSF